MRRLWLYVYNVFSIPFIWLVFRFLSVFNSKIRDGFRGRKNIFSELEKNKSLLTNGNKNIVIHCSSLGEYQQAIPIYQELLNHGYNIIVTFFSPSGYNNSKITDKRILKVYLPFDTYYRIKKFVDIINPEYIIMVRYDLWFNFLYRAKKRNITTVIANARFDVKDITWKIPLISSFKKCMFKMIDILFAIDDEDEANFKRVLKDNCKIIKVGDSKFERVLQSSRTIKKDEVLGEEIIRNKKVVVMGSSWKEDEEILLPVLNKIWKYEPELLVVLVPHEPKETKIAMIEKNVLQNYENLKSIRYSNIKMYSGENLIIVDCIGILLKLYSISYVSYVGGGLKSGLHNILEPAIFNVPVFFANEVKNSDEDEVLLKYGSGILVDEKNKLYRDMRILLSNRFLRDSIGEKNKLVFSDKTGIAKKIVNNLLTFKNSK